MDSLSFVGVIATLLGVLFALAAFWNSRKRRKHEQALRAATDGERRRLRVKPMPATPPVPTPAAAARGEGSGSASVFKQATPAGSAEPVARASAEEIGYVWE